MPLRKRAGVYFVPLFVLSTTELTVLFTPLIFSILVCRTFLNSSMSAATTSVTMSNSPVTC